MSNTIQYTCRRCHVRVTDTMVYRYCGKCRKIIQKIKDEKQGVKHGS